MHEHDSVYIINNLNHRAQHSSQQHADLINDTCPVHVPTQQKAPG